MYRFLIGYFRVKILKIILARLLGSKVGKNKNLKTMNLMSYVAELAGSYLLEPKKKPGKK